MFEIYNFSQNEIIAFILIAIRVGVFVAMMPLFGGEQLAPPIKVLLGLVMTFVIFPTIAWRSQQEFFVTGLVWLALKEAAVGIILGFISKFFFYILTIAGEIMSVSIGLSAEQLFNPALGGRSAALQQFQILLGSLLFLILNGHHQLIIGLVKSFDIIPLSMQGLKALSMQDISLIGQEIIWEGVKMAAPVMTAIFFMNLVMGIMGRAVPQINVLVTSLPINVLVGFMIILISIPLMVATMEVLTEKTAIRLFEVMKSL